MTGGPRVQEARFFAARFLSLARLSRASFFSKSFFDTLRTILSALLSRSAGVSPGTRGAGDGLMAAVYHRPFGAEAPLDLCWRANENTHEAVMCPSEEHCGLPGLGPFARLRAQKIISSLRFLVLLLVLFH